MSWLLFRIYKLGWKRPYLRWRIYRYAKEQEVDPAARNHSFQGKKR